MQNFLSYISPDSIILTSIGVFCFVTVETLFADRRNSKGICVLLQAFLFFAFGAFFIVFLPPFIGIIAKTRLSEIIVPLTQIGSIFILLGAVSALGTGFALSLKKIWN